MEEKITRTYVSFSGADVVVFLNKKPVGEAEQLHYKENLVDGGVKGFLKVTLFDRDAIDPTFIKENNGSLDIEIRFCNEYGQMMARYLNGVTFTSFETEVHIDQIIQQGIYEFKAESTSILTAKHIKDSNTLSEMIAYLVANKDIRCTREHGINAEYVITTIAAEQVLQDQGVGHKEAKSIVKSIIG